MLELKFDTSAFAKLARDLAQTRAKIPMAIAQGLNRGGDLVRTQVQRALKEQTNVKLYRSITSRVRTVRAFESSLSYSIVATGHGIPIEEFPVTVTRKGVDAQSWDVDHLFQRSFQQKFKGGLRARLTSSRYPTRKLLGPALPKELVKDAIPGVFQRSAAEHVPAAIERAIAGVIR